MIYPKNIVTYSAYVRNMEGFIKSALNMKKDIKLAHVEQQESNCSYDQPLKKNASKKTGKGSDTTSISNKQINTTSSKKSAIKNSKINADSVINEDNHPSLRRRYARLFITVPK